MPKTEFAEKLRRLRKDAGLTQAELAEKLEISRSSVSGYEKGLFVPDIQALAAAAEFFNVSADWLIGRPGAVKSANPNIAALCKYTGLSEAAVDKLHAARLEMGPLDHLSAFLAATFNAEALDYYLDGATQGPIRLDGKAQQSLFDSAGLIIDPELIRRLYEEKALDTLRFFIYEQQAKQEEPDQITAFQAFGPPQPEDSDGGEE